MPAIQVIAGDRDITAVHDGLQLSNVDPGGFETLQLNPQLVDGLRPGAPVWVRWGGEVMGHYRINEPGQHDKGDRTDFTIAALGYGAKLKDDPIRRIYVDRDLSHFAGVSVQHRINLIAAAFSAIDPAVQPDTTTGQPALASEVSDAWVVGARPVARGMYDSGGIPIGSLYYAWKRSSTILVADTNWVWETYLSSDDVVSSSDTSGVLLAAGPGAGTLVATTARTFAFASLYYLAAGGAAGTKYDIWWTCLAVYGDHGLTKRGTASFTEAQGFYTSDIVRDAATGQGYDLQIDDATGLVVAHSTYMQPTTREQIVSDMGKLAGGWHWGVWEPRSIFSEQPTFIYTAPPSRATCIVGRRECDELEVPKVRLDQLYDTAIVAYRDPAGTSGYVTVTLDNPLLDETEVGSRTLALDLGIGSAAAATTFGTFALKLAFRSARGGGWAILPDTVMLPGGGRKPACLLHSGRDRIQINDLPDTGPLTEADTRRYDTFLIRRVEPTIDEHGVPRTRVEFDGGADLLEVLQARLAIASVLAGAG